MHAAMNVGVVVLVVARDRVDHRLRLLRRGGVVEVDQRLAVNLLLENREIARGSSARRSRHRRCARAAGCDSSAICLAAVVIRLPPSFSGVLAVRRLVARGSARLRQLCNRRAMDQLFDVHRAAGPCFMRSRHSPAKAKSSRLRADTSSMPRERR